MLHAKIWVCKGNAIISLKNDCTRNCGLNQLKTAIHESATTDYRPPTTAPITDHCPDHRPLPRSPTTAPITDHCPDHRPLPRSPTTAPITDHCPDHRPLPRSPTTAPITDHCPNHRIKPPRQILMNEFLTYSTKILITSSTYEIFTWSLLI